MRMPRRTLTTIFALACLAAAAAGAPARAMQFGQEPAGGGALFLTARGQIVAGDYARFAADIARVAPGQRVLALALDSPGGSVAEAVRLSDLIRHDRLGVFIPSDAKCASACFLLLAAAPRRFAGSDALIGVHSASEAGAETQESLAVTTEMARFAADFGIPPVILGKMVETGPQRMEWLTRGDLAAMQVVVLNDAQIPAEGAPPAASVPAVPVLAPPVAGPAIAASGAEFRGAFFCGPGPAKLTLKLLRSADPARSRAVFSFGPTPTNRAVPSGSFVVEGRLDMGGGTLDLRPVTWLSQPAGVALLGLLGRSDDGGRTF